MTEKVNDTLPETPDTITWGPISAILMTLLAFFGGQIIGILVLVAVVALFSGSGVEVVFNRLANTDMGSWYQFLSILAVEVATLLIILLYLRSRGASLRTLGLKNFQAFDILRSLAGFAGYFTLYFMVITVAKAVLPALNLEQQQELGFDTALRGVELIPVFLSLVILPPFVEEILCRGFLYGGLRTKLKPVGAALITSGLFAAAHLQWGSNTPLLWVAAIDTFVLSLVLCYLREKSGRLWASIGLHVIKNLVAFLALFVFKLA